MPGDALAAVVSTIVLVVLAGSLLVGWKASRGRSTLRAALRARKEPRLSARQPPPACPFCGQEMRPGRLANRSGGAYPVVWEPMDAPPRGRLASPYLVATPDKLVIGISHQATRGASVCEACAAVVVDPEVIAPPPDVDGR